MKRLIILVAAVAVVGLFPSHSAEAGGKKTAITGTVVDAYCLITMDMGGKSHKPCATTCAKSGAPLSIKEDKTGTVYLVAGHEKNMTFASSGLEQYVEQRVIVRGTVYERDGLRMIVVDSAAPAN